MRLSEPKPISATQYSHLPAFRPKASAAWGGFAAHVVDRPTAFSEAVTFADHVLSLRISGSCRLRQKAGGRSLSGRSGPGSVHVIPARYSATWEASAASGGSRVIAMFVPEDCVRRLVDEEWEIDSRRVEILPQFLAHDPIIEGVVTRLAVEAQHGSPSGRLYAESACEFLARHLICTYSSVSRPLPRATGGLSGRRLQRVLEYIEETLGESVGLRQIAALAGVSPRHFERAFRQAVGVSPHAYVMQRRVAAARGLLLDDASLTVEDIAARVGFASSSHLASAFRRSTGYSPSSFRRAHGR